GVVLERALVAREADVAVDAEDLEVNGFAPVEARDRGLRLLEQRPQRGMDMLVDLRLVLAVPGLVLPVRELGDQAGGLRSDPLKHVCLLPRTATSSAPPAQVRYPAPE